MSRSVVTFGEVMGRIAPMGASRFSQCLPGAVDFTFGGGEANVAVSLSVLGVESALVTALPRNAIADACVRQLRGLGVDTSGIIRTDGGRVGLYYLEGGANQLGSVVTYDRDGSSVMLTPADAYDWSALLAGARWFHFTGITPALSEQAASAAAGAAMAAQAAGLTVSCDLNFRRKLWNWRPGAKPRDLAESTMRALLPYVGVVIANEEDAEQVLGIRADETNVDAGRLNASGYAAVARQIAEQFANVSMVAITLRESVSASHNNWGGMLYDRASDTVRFAPLGPAGEYAPYQIRDIVDRVGGGDAFAAGLIYGLLSASPDPGAVLAFAAAASCLKHSIPGDYNYATRGEVEALASGSASGRVSR